MKARAYVVHSVPGRIRFRIPERRNYRAFFREIEKRLTTLEGVNKVETNPKTSSVLVHYDGDIQDLLARATCSPLADLVELELSSPPVARRLRAEMTALDRGIRRFTNGEFDLKTLASIGLLAMAGVQIMRRGSAVGSVSLAWYAGELLRRWNEPSPGAEKG